MMAAVESYLAVRRATGFTLSNTEYLLRSFAGFAAGRKQTHIRTATAIEWAGQAASLAQRHTRYQTICRFAQYLQLVDSRHQSPPANYFGYRKTRRVPHIYSRDEIKGLIVAATRLPSSDSLLPKTYAALISLLAATGLRISEALHLLVSDITPNGFCAGRAMTSLAPHMEAFLREHLARQRGASPPLAPSYSAREHSFATVAPRAALAAAVGRAAQLRVPAAPAVDGFAVSTDKLNSQEIRRLRFTRARTRPGCGTPFLGRVAQ